MAKRKIVSWEQKKKRYGYFFVLPFIIGAIFFIISPMISSIAYSFSSLQVTTTGYELDFVGIKNFRHLLAVDPTYRKVLLNSLVDMVCNVPIAIIFSFFIASVLNTKFKGRTIFRGIFFIPVFMASGIYRQLENVDQLTQMMSNESSASAGSISASFVNFLTEMNLSADIIDLLVGAVDRISAIVAMSAIPIIIFLSAFQSISPSIFEASYIEGASKWEVFWKISFPMVSSQILVCVIYTIIDSFTSSSNTMINLVHTTSFNEFNFGLGAAMIWIYLIAIAVIVAIVYSCINKYIFYYD